MKRLVIFLTVFLIVASSFAQLAKMRLTGKAEKSEDEIVAVRDANGRFCAAIKVLSDMEGFSYDAYNGVVRVDDRPGEDMVYLQPDERVLIIYHTGYEPLKLILSDYGISLQPKEVWRIRIKGQAKTGDLLPVTVFVQPADAHITIDGKPVQSGKAVRLSKGRHRLKIEKNGFRAVDKTIKVTEDNVVFNSRLNELEPVAVQISSQPSGAQIFIDNMDKGQTDRGLWLFPGVYRLKLQLPGYVDVNEAIEVKENGSNTFTYRLIKNSGVLRLSVTPAGAAIKLNQIDYSGQTRIELLPGKYELEITKPGYLPKKEIIEIERGKTLSRSYQLIKNSGSLTLDITPPDAQVLINKEDYSGRSRIELAPGMYKIEISKAGWYPVRETITIERGRTLSKTYRLTPRTGKLQFSVQPLNARVTLKRNGQTVQTWTGMKYLKNLQVGDYELECSADGYSTQTKRITIKEGQTAVLDIKLKKGVSYGTMTDQDGNVYKTVKIGDQVWMAENLRVTHYRNGDPIPNVTSNWEWSHLRTGARCAYNNNNGNVTTYGLLYNWYALTDRRNIAPEGWHVPTDEEWKELERYLGSNAGGKLKERGTSHWKSPNEGATNSSGFTALPGGSRNYHGTFYDIGDHAYFWSSTEYGRDYAWLRHLYYNLSGAYRDDYDKLDGFSVRCVRD